MTVVLGGMDGSWVRSPGPTGFALGVTGFTLGSTGFMSGLVFTLGS